MQRDWFYAKTRKIPPASPPLWMRKSAGGRYDNLVKP